ncbi:MAG: DNA-directed RNA polymerase subunit beta [Clostridiales bacterium]|nr:DNA-directed RNA polymerase subunit beta [Clostridiales bacterium]
MVHPVKLGENTRMSYGKINEVMEMPNLIEIQTNSYKWFLDEGLKEVFHDISPITDYAGNLVLEFIDYRLESTPKYDIEECKERDATYAAPLRVKVRLKNKESGEVKEQEIFMGEFPLMTPSGTFIINGAERVIVSQLVRAPSVYFSQDYDKIGKKLFSSQVIPNRGAWLEYETDSNDIYYVRIDRTRKIPVTVLIRALGYGTDAEITELFGEDERLLATMEKDTTKTHEEGLLEVYRRLRPGEPPTVDSAQALISSTFFDPKRYDMAKVGRYKYNKKLMLSDRVTGQIAAEDIFSPVTGEQLCEAGQKITKELAHELEVHAVNEVVLDCDGKQTKVISNNMVDMPEYINCKMGIELDYNPRDCGITERVRRSILDEIIDQYPEVNSDEFKAVIEERRDELQPRHVLTDDIISSMSYICNLANGVGSVDDIDHLGNRRIRSVGELLQNQFRIGLSRMERVVRERMTTSDLDTITPQTLINVRPVTSAIKEFFGSSQLSQFMDQINPLGELTHKRRLSALGPGGLSRERAGYEVRDVHHSHYGRMCPIETPEGPNIGLINSLSGFAKVNEYGFIETPYRRVDQEKGIVTDEVTYMTADFEEGFYVAQANEPLNDDGSFVNKKIVTRFKDEFIEVPPNRVDYMDVSPRQVTSIATAMIPFLENDDANRALMGSNMQRQAVPLLVPESPIIGTGMEYKAAKDSGVCVLAKRAGEVTYVSATKIVIRTEDGDTDTYKMVKFTRSNQGMCINQKPIVSKGQVVKKDQIIADGPSTKNGEIGLGRNIRMAFMTWEGYNYEDAILISEELVKEDVFTSIHIEEHEADARDTKLGPEEITRDIPNVGEDALKDLDERGIIRIGAEVESGDILVGKVTPKGETELTAEERLLRAIFGEKAREVRDTSLRVPHGEYGIIVDVKVFTRSNGDELPPGVNQVVRCYIAQKRKISVGDKMAGRHGNKGVVSRILPVEDMPFLPDGTPLQIVLNPLGVPSRMNIGQVLEVHLGYAAKALGWKVATPVFDGATEDDIMEALKQAGYNEDGKSVLYDGRTGEPFDNRVTVGYMHMLKLAHLVDDKIHARSTGPYSLVTQQPLGGKAQFGGQRFGEMEVWALEAYGAAYTLQEILTVKSDDVVGRVKTYEAIVKGENVPEPGVPESFKVLIKELQSLALDIKVLDGDGNEVVLKDSLDDDDVEELPVNIAGYEESDDIAPQNLDNDEDDDLLIDDADDEDEDENVDVIDEVTQILATPSSEMSTGEMSFDNSDNAESLEELRAAEDFDDEDDDDIF